MTDVEVATARFCAWDLIIRPDSVLEFARLGDGVARNRRQDTPNTLFVFAIRYFFNILPTAAFSTITTCQLQK